MSGSVIVAGARTPMDKMLGGLKSVTGASAIRTALERAGVTAEQVQYVIMGQVLAARLLLRQHHHRRLVVAGLGRRGGGGEVSSPTTEE